MPYPALPSRIGPYTPLKCLRKRFPPSLVYLAEGLRKKVAVKAGEKEVVWEESDFLHSLGIRHPRVVSIENGEKGIYTGEIDENMFKVGLVGGRITIGYFSMEFLDGETLDEVIEKKGAMSPLRVVNHMFEISKALRDFLWVKNKIHGDIKPDNIMEVTEELWKIFDFQIGALYAAGVFGRRELNGSPSHLPLEEFTNHFPDHRRDFYSMGITIYELVTGRLFIKHFGERKINAEAFDHIDYAQIFSDPKIPVSLRKFLLRNCHRKLSARIADPNQFMHEFSEVQRRLAG